MHHWNGDEKNLEEAWESIIKEEIPKRMGSREELFKDAFKRFLDEGCCHYAPKVFTDMELKQMDKETWELMKPEMIVEQV